MLEILKNTLGLALEAAPWLLLGLVLAGAIRALIPQGLMQRWLGGSGLWPVTKAALVGAPIPICSCGVVPAAISLRKSGASTGSTLSFLIATPETGVDSVALTYALMGPFMAVVRPVAAILSAIGVGVTSSLAERRDVSPRDEPPAISACCCQTEERGADDPDGAKHPGETLASGLRYAFSDLYDEIVPWLALGLLAAGIVLTFVSPDMLGEMGSGLPAKIVMFLVGIPMYICASASTPLAASLLLAGVSPGTVLVFLLAGPATNLGTIGIIRREFGSRVLTSYLLGLAAFTITAGSITDLLASGLAIDIAAQLQEGQHLFPVWLQASAVALLVIFAIPRLRAPLFDLASRTALR
jgi:uncharacterized membrane protein YraQ (UPF0718 family)